MSLEHLTARLEALVERAEVNAWDDLAGELIFQGLFEAVRLDRDDRAAELYDRCWRLVREPRLTDVVRSYVRFRDEEDWTIQRLTRNLRRLVLSAGVARKARSIEDWRLLNQWDQQLQEEYGSEISVDGDNGLATAEFVKKLSQAGQSVIRYMARSSSACPELPALYWSLYWLGDDHHAIETVDAPLSIPLAGCLDGQDVGANVHLELRRLPEAWRHLLVEHPRNALAPLGPDLYEAMGRAWRLGVNLPPSAVWRLIPGSRAVRRGASLTGAAAAGFAMLSHETPYYDPKFLILSDIAEDACTLKAVGGLENKLRAALNAEIASVAMCSAQKEEYGHLADELLTPAGREILWLSDIREVISHAAGAAGLNVALSSNQTVLGRYTLRERLDKNRDRLWLAARIDGHDEELALVKLWVFKTDDPSGQTEVFRVQWDRELRVSYRLSSSPGAESCLLQLKDAEIDRQFMVHRREAAFVMVFTSNQGGYKPLSHLLARRTESGWLQFSALSDWYNRRALWRGIHTIARAIRMVHEQRSVHRNVCAESVYVDPEKGPASFRLGGFEWALRLGEIERDQDVDKFIAPLDRPSGWVSPPESYLIDAAVGPASDWHGLGMIAARCFLSLETADTSDGRALNGSVRRMVRSTGLLSPREQQLLLSLTEPNPAERLSNWPEVDAYIQELLESDQPEPVVTTDRPLHLLLYAGESTRHLARAAVDGLVLKAEERSALLRFNPRDLEHRRILRRAIQQDLQLCTVVYLPAESDNAARPRYALRGGRLYYSIRPYRAPHRGLDVAQLWDFARLEPRRSLPEARLGHSRLVRSKIRVRWFDFEFRNDSEPPTISWTRFLPRPPKEEIMPAAWIQFQQFLRCTNQIELMMRRHEIFRYRTDPTKDRWTNRGNTFVRIYSADDSRPERRIYYQSLDMVQHFEREVESGRLGESSVVLTSEPEEPSLWQKGGDVWHLFDFRKDHIVLEKIGDTTASIPKQGYVRSRGHFGQIALLERRQQAIERLSLHGYLMKALTQPSEVWMDTRSSVDTTHLENTKLDQEQKDVVKALLSARPIYLVNGPPGTGKSTMVAHSLGSILRDDPGAQILVTAQGHGAVDALRVTIQEERVFEGLGAQDRPIEIRMGARSFGGEGSDSTIDSVCADLLERSRQSFQAEPPRTAAGTVWQDTVVRLANETKDLAQERARGERMNDLPFNKDEETTHPVQAPSRDLRSFHERVLASANVVYATTSAGDLNELARGRTSFDWTIVEEASKAHAFDLALPLAVGHRWLLLGDEFQLPPYRHKDFEKAIRHVDQLIEMLKQLAPGNPGLIDWEFITWWENLQPPEHKNFRTQTADLWIRCFGNISRNLKAADRARGADDGQIQGCSVGTLTGVYRMHPDICWLVSQTYYDGTLRPMRDARALAHDIDDASLRGVAVAWLNLPWGSAKGAGQTYLENNRPLRSNPKEVESIGRFLSRLSFNGQAILEVAFLSPYSEQTRLLQAELDRVSLPVPLRLRRSLVSRRDGRPRVAYTVDSFQGNQADLVFVSLVRNNRMDPGEGLGFLSEHERMNVLISRGSRLLVLVGCWEFFQNQLRSMTEDDDDYGHLCRLFRKLEDLRLKKRMVLLQAFDHR